MQLTTQVQMRLKPVPSDKVVGELCGRSEFDSWVY